MVEPADRFCRSCGAEQPPAPQPRVDDDETEQLTGAESGGLEPPTEESTRVEPPTERQPHAEETEAIAASAGTPAPSAPGAPTPRAPERRPPKPPPPPAAPSPGGPEPRPFEPPAKPEGERAGGKRKLAAIAIAVVLGLVAGLVAVIAINGGGDSQRAQTTSGQTAATTLDPVESLRQHFDLLEQGRFLAASDGLTPSLLDSLGGKAIWVSERIADLMVDAQLDATVIDESDTSATVQVNSLRTESLINGCTDFTGTYGMERSGESWLIDSADLIDSPC